MLQKLIDIICDQLDVSEEIGLETSFVDDLGADSLDLFDLIMRLEDEFGVRISSEELSQITTVGNLYNYVNVNE